MAQQMRSINAPFRVPRAEERGSRGTTANFVKCRGRLMTGDNFAWSSRFAVVISFPGRFGGALLVATSFSVPFANAFKRFNNTVLINGRSAREGHSGNKQSTRSGLRAGACKLTGASTAQI